MLSYSTNLGSWVNLPPGFLGDATNSKNALDLFSIQTLWEFENKYKTVSLLFQLNDFFQLWHANLSNDTLA